MTRFHLETWRRFIRYHPWHFWGMADTDIIPIMSSCDMLVREHSWLATEMAGRADCRDAIDQALEKMTRYLRYSPIPHQQIDYSLNVLGAGAYHLGVAQWPGKYTNSGMLQLTEGYVQAIGREVLTSIGQDTALVRLDDDGDGLKERFTVGFPLPADVPLSELGVFFTADDRPGGAPLADEWEIPVTFIVNTQTNTLTATGPGYLLVRPILYQGFKSDDNQGLDPTDDSIFVTGLDLVRRTVDATNAVQVTSVTGGACCEAGTSATYAGSATIIDAKNGIIQLDGLCGCSTPKRATVAYVAGVPLANQRMADARWEQAICKMACAELARSICACDRPNAPIVYYSRDLSLQDNGTQPPQAEALRWFGPKQGHAEAWSVVSHEYHAVSLTM